MSGPVDPRPGPDERFAAVSPSSGPGVQPYPRAYPPPAPAPPVPRRKVGRIVVAVAVAGVLLLVGAVVVVVVGVVVAQRGTAHSITIPAKAGNQVRLSTPVAKKVGDSVLHVAQSSDSTRIYAKAKVGVYGTSAKARPEVILVGLSVADSPELAREIRVRSAHTAMDTIVASAKLSGERDYPPGPFGGRLVCGNLNTGSRALATCFWLDRATFAIVYQIVGSPDSAAVVTKVLRAAAEK